LTSWGVVRFCGFKRDWGSSPKRKLKKRENGTRFSKCVFFFKLKEISLLKKRNEAQLWKEKKTEKDKTEI